MQSFAERACRSPVGAEHPATGRYRPAQVHVIPITGGTQRCGRSPRAVSAACAGSSIELRDGAAKAGGRQEERRVGD